MISRYQDKFLSFGRPRNWVIGIVSALMALAALVLGRLYGNANSKSIHEEVVAWVAALVVLVFGVIATGRASRIMAHRAHRRSPSAASGVRVVSAIVGYVITVAAALAVVDISHALAGAGVAGIVLGIAAQQSLGNIFAGLVLLATKPFVLGDRVRVRAGALGGIFDAVVVEQSLTYVTLRTDDGLLKVPNSVVMAAGLLKLPPTGPVPPLAVVLPPAPPAFSPTPPAPGPAGADAPGNATAEGQA